MHNKLHHLAIKKAKLQAEASAQRDDLSIHAAQWQMRLTWVDRGLAATRFVKNNPGMILGAGALFAMFTPIKAATRGFSAVARMARPKLVWFTTHIKTARLMTVTPKIKI